MAMHKIGIIGSGNVGGALACGLKRAGHEVRMAGRDPAAIRATASWAEIVLLAVPFGAIDDVVAGAGEAVSGELVPRSILSMTSCKATKSRCRNAPDGRETFQSVNPGHKPERRILSGGCSDKSSACDSEREASKYQAATGV